MIRKLFLVGLVCSVASLAAPLAHAQVGSFNGNGNTGTGNGNGNGNGNENGNSNGNNNGNNNGSGNALSSAASNSLTVNRPRNAPSVNAPGLAAAGIESCLGSASVGGSGPGFGLAIGGTTEDKDCNIRLYARTLYAMGYRVAAVQLLCTNPDVAHALAYQGLYCGAMVRRSAGGPVAEYVPPRRKNRGIAPADGCRHYELLGGCRDAEYRRRGH